MWTLLRQDVMVAIGAVRWESQHIKRSQGDAMQRLWLLGAGGLDL